MDATRRLEIAVAILFIMATVLFSVGQVGHVSILGDPNYLDLAGPAAGRIAAGTLAEFVGVLAIPLTAVFVFPILRLHSEPLALAYVTIRTVEAVPLLLVEGAIFATVDVSQSSLGALGTIDWPTAGAAIQALREATFYMSVGLVFPIGCLLFNTMLLKTGLIPKWIAAWGMAAAVLLFTGSLVSRFGLLAGVPPTVLEAVAAGPVAVQEMVFALWLIVKGFNADALATLRGG